MLPRMSFSLRPLGALALVVVGAFAGDVRAEIDCAQCRAVCRDVKRYPDELNPDAGVPVKHRSPESQAAFEEGKKFDPGLGGGDAKRAVEAYKRAVFLDPQNSQYRNHLAAALLTTGNADEAVYNLEQALRLVPSEPKYFVNLGYALHRKGEEQRALVWYLRALMLDPRDVRARLFAGFAMEILGMRQEAVMEFRRVVQQEPKHPGATAALARLGAPSTQPFPLSPPPDPSETQKP